MSMTASRHYPSQTAESTEMGIILIEIRLPESNTPPSFGGLGRPCYGGSPTLRYTRLAANLPP